MTSITIAKKDLINAINECRKVSKDEIKIENNDVTEE